MENELLQKTFLTNKDISKIMNCSSSKATVIKNKIRELLKKQGKDLFTDDIPTSLFRQFMNMDVKLYGASLA